MRKYTAVSSPRVPLSRYSIIHSSNLKLYIVNRQRVKVAVAARGERWPGTKPGWLLRDVTRKPSVELDTRVPKTADPLQKSPAPPRPPSLGYRCCVSHAFAPVMSIMAFSAASASAFPQRKWRCDDLREPLDDTRGERESGMWR